MIELSANGPLFTLPAGPLRLTAAVGARREAIFTNADGSTSRMRQFERDARLAIDVPISSADGFLAPLGNLSIGAELRRGRVSDQGRSSSTTLTTQWQPFESLRLFGSISRGRAPLSLSLLADPIVVTPGERFFDPLTGTSPDVSAVTGGNPDLSPSTTREQRLSIQFKPIKRLELDLSADYTRTDSRNIPSILPAASAIAMAVFPERFVRDDGGTLILVDLRTVNFARQCEEQLRYGFNLTLPLAALRSAKREDRPGGRFQLSASHTILLSSQLVIRQGMAPINLLSAESVAFGGAMRPRHRFDFSFGYAERGLGIRFSGESRSESFLDASAPGSTDTLRFSPLFTMGLRAFVEGSRIAPTLPWLKGARLSLAVVNIGNARARVRDDLGSTPLAFQPVYNDPLGRTIELEFRKAL